MAKNRRRSGMRKKRTRRSAHLSAEYQSYQPNNPLTVYFERMFAKQRKSK